jgi:D-alanyl-lipoteichoic acid acyltransferase DltB (MBOAT superfamily)
MPRKSPALAQDFTGVIFNSYGFLFVYAPIALAGYIIISRFNQHAAIWFLSAASFAFYWHWQGPWKILLPISIVFNFIAAQILIRSRSPARRYAILTFAVLADLALLIAFKYSTFLLGILTGREPDIGLGLPLGISFYTFTQIAFLVDTARDRGQTSFRDYILFVSFFPHLIAGPIIHHRNVIPQFARREHDPIRWALIEAGLLLLFIGLVKKALLADGIAPFANECFDQLAYVAHARPVADAYICTFAYTFQLYFDFSGYSDMALGLSFILGISIPINFNSPYKAGNITDFWRRWHISLSSFLRDYLYIPLGGNRLGRVAQYRNMFVVMVLGGAWHGSGWTFIAWGAWHGALLVLNRAWHESTRRFNIPPMPAFFGITLTFVFVALGWVFFRAPDLSVATDMFKALGGGGPLFDSAMTFRTRNPGPLNSVALQYYTKYSVAAAWLAICALIVFFCPSSQALTQRLFADEASRYRRLAIVAAGLIGTAAISTTSEFIYFNF